MVNNLKQTKMENTILFRSHRAGDIMTNKQGSVITEKQLAMWDDYATRIREGGKITDKQKQTFKELTIKKNKPFELSDTAKSAVRSVWLKNEKGFIKSIKSKYLDKGIFGEEIGMSLLTEVDGRFYSKNTERIIKGNRTGECDSIFEIDPKLSLTPEIYKGRKVKVIQDVKCCWDADTFMRSDFDHDYEWQGRDYMDQYDVDEFWLRYCLVDCPDHLVKKEKDYLFNKYYSDSMDDVETQKLEEMLEPLFQQIERNLVYSTNPAYNKEERVKTFKITRDDAIFQEYLDRIPHCLDFYKTIKLNNQFI